VHSNSRLVGKMEEIDHIDERSSNENYIILINNHGNLGAQRRRKKAHVTISRSAARSSHAACCWKNL